MSKYTMTLQEYCQGVYVGLHPDLSPVQAISQMEESDYYEIVSSYVFPSSWDLYTADADAKAVFVRDFTDRFMYFEIGQSSFEQFRHVLKTWLRTEMSYYTQLYNSQLASLDDVLNTVDVWRNIYGTTSGKTGTVGRAGSVTYGHVETRDLAGGVTHGETQANNIVPLGATATEREISKQIAGGTDSTTDTGTVTESGTDTNGYTDTYDTLDRQDLTEHRAGKENINVGTAVEKFRELIVDINSMMLNAMKRYGLFMVVW